MGEILMRILFISNEGDSLSIAQRVDREDHKALLYINNPEARKVGDGLVEKIGFTLPIVNGTGKVNKNNVSKLLDIAAPNLVVFDMVKLGEVADTILSMGYPVFGGSKWSDLAELHRDYGIKLMKAAGIDTPPSQHFKSGDTNKAIAFINSSDKRYVYKPSGNIETSHTYVSKGRDDLIAMLQLWKNDKADFELQEYIEGVEVSAELWWNGFTSSNHNWTMEEKALMNEGIGATTGCMGNIVCRCREKDRLISEGVGKMERLLKKTNYRGVLDLNAIVTKDKLYGLEFTTRFGYDAIQAFLTLFKGSISKLLFDIATGKNTENNFYLDTAIAVRLSIPPYPSEGAVESIPILGVNKFNDKYLWFSDIVKDGTSYKCSGFDGMLGCATAKGSTIRECKRRVYRTIEQLVIPQVQYRTDIGDRVSSDLLKLKEWGWL